MENVVKLLNSLLEIDRAGISYFMLQNIRVDIRISNTPVELVHIGSETYADLNPIGMINGVLHSMINNPKERVVFVLRDPVTIDYFMLSPVPELDDASEIHIS